MGERGSVRHTAAECPGEQAAAEGQTPVRSHGTALFSVPSKPPEVGGWKLASSAQSRKENKKNEGIYLGILK